MFYCTSIARRGNEHVVWIYLFTTSTALPISISARLLQFEKMEGIPELGVISEQADEETGSGERQGTPRTPGGDVPDQGPAFPDPQQHQRQVSLTHSLTHSLTDKHTHCAFYCSEKCEGLPKHIICMQINTYI